MSRVEAALFASARPVLREDPARVVGAMNALGGSFDTLADARLAIDLF